MYTEALLLANDHIRINAVPGSFAGSAALGEQSEPAFVRMSDAIDHPAAYARLTDSVIRMIEYSADPGLKPARDLVLRIRKRDLYPYVGLRLPFAVCRASSLLQLRSRARCCVQVRRWCLH